MEHWVEIDDFPGYEVSDQGRVRNARTRRVLGIYDNGGDVRQVVMRRDGRNVTRAVHKLVAYAFLDPAPEDCVPIHINGDRDDNAAENLTWKPRWYAIKRTRQFNRTTPRDPRRIRHVKSNTIFENALECAVEIDGLEELVLITAQSRYGATYKGSAFEFVYD